MLVSAFLRDSGTAAWLQFENPVHALCAESAADVPDLLEDLELRVRRDRLFAVGFLTYEAAPAFDRALLTRTRGRLPAASFALFSSAVKCGLPRARRGADSTAARWQLGTPRDDYLRNVAEIRRQIELGNCYQANLTMRQQAVLGTDPWELFLQVATEAPYSAYLDDDEFAIVSASPELFFSLENDEISCRPMKGTARRGMTAEADRAAALELRASVKDRAENVMITDMIRNDLGRIAEAGSVDVVSLYDIERYPTVWQMTSTVKAASKAPIRDLFSALFPSASVTGAPKVSSMAIIRDLEDSPREIYTGAIGFLAPGGRAQFNVAIRTAWIDKSTRRATYGIGSGIVWDSDPDAEFDECLAKAKVLTAPSQREDFDLIETMLWTPGGGFWLLEEHLERLRASAEYFGFAFDRQAVLPALQNSMPDGGNRRLRVRLRLLRHGEVNVEYTPVAHNEPGRVLRLVLAREPVDVEDPFLYHKTTRRRVYDHAMQSAGKCDDVLLWNADGFITETTIANVLAEIDGKLVTPPVDCGLLGGTYRRWLLANRRIEERKIHKDELVDSQSLTLINSVRGEFQGELAVSSG